jgi:hypothetical protein
MLWILHLMLLSASHPASRASPRKSVSRRPHPRRNVCAPPSPVTRGCTARCRPLHPSVPELGASEPRRQSSGPPCAGRRSPRLGAAQSGTGPDSPSSPSLTLVCCAARGDIACAGPCFPSSLRSTRAAHLCSPSSAGNHRSRFSAGPWPLTGRRSSPQRG